MNINTKSWHYRLITQLDFRVPDNLCAYFWKVVLSVCLILFFVALGSLVVFALFIGLIYLPFFSYELSGRILGAVVWTLLGIISLHGVRQIYHEIEPESWMFYPIISVDLVQKNDNILIAYLASIHDKVCPTLEFRRDDQ